MKGGEADSRMGRLSVGRSPFWLGFEELQGPPDEGLVVLKDPGVSGVGVEGDEFASG